MPGTGPVCVPSSGLPGAALRVHKEGRLHGRGCGLGLHSVPDLLPSGHSQWLWSLPECVWGCSLRPAGAGPAARPPSLSHVTARVGEGKGSDIREEYEALLTRGPAAQVLGTPGAGRTVTALSYGRSVIPAC